MHILVTADTVGGVWTYTRELVSGLASRGIQVTLVSFGGIPTAQQKHWIHRTPGVDYLPTNFKLEWMQDAETDLIESEKYLMRVIRERQPDLLHLSQYHYGALPCDVPRIVVAHSDVVSWNVAVHGEEPADSIWLRQYRALVKRGIKGATTVVAPTRWMLEQIRRYYVKPAHGVVVYNGRSPELFNPHVAKEKMIVTVGRQWDEAKNSALLLEREMPSPVCIVGPDRHPETQGQAFGVNGAKAAVRFMGQQEERELSELLARATIYAATSSYEPFGLAPVEAALSRCAIVASDIPPFRELWDGAALFFRNKDAESLSNAMELLTSERSLVRSYGNLALSRARQRFNADRMVDEYLSLYTDVASTLAA